MRAARVRTLLRRGLPVVLMGGVLVRLVVLAGRPLDNLDTYFHLRFGHEFLSGSWSVRDPGSVTTAATADWVPTQWLSQVVMARTEEWLGVAGVAWLSGLLFVTLAVAAYAACRRRAEPLVAAGLVALALIACTPGLSMRPQMVSYVLVVATAAAWLRARDTGRAPWLLVPVTWVWAMCHGMWPVGIAIGVAAVAGLALDRAHPAPTLLRCATVPVLSAAAALVTPVGPALLPAVVEVGSRREHFREWGTPDPLTPYGIAVLVLLLLAVVPRLRRGSTSWFDVALIGLAAAGAAWSQRTVPVAACLLAPLVAAGIQARIGPRPDVRRGERALVATGAALALVALAIAVPHTANRPRASPAWLDGALGDLPAGTAVVGETAYGGYLMWRFPQLDVVAHGYGDTYTDAELERNADIQAVRDGWAEQLARTGAEYAVLPPGSELAEQLRVRRWVVVEHTAELELLQAPPGWPD